MNLKLKQLRQAKGYTTKDMAEKLEISKAFYCQLENNKRNLSYIMAIKIANIFNKKPDTIFYEDFKQRMWLFFVLFLKYDMIFIEVEE